MSASDGRISEREIAEEAVKVLATRGRGFMTTSDLIAELEHRMEPSGEDSEIIDGRHDTKFSQKVRNLVSHRDSANGLETRGLATYDDERGGWEITPKGRQHAC